MEPALIDATDLGDDLGAQVAVHAWRAEQLRRLGLRSMLAERFADRIDWHEFARLVKRGCTPELALEIVRP
jgi:hypothetical protein